MEMPLPKTRGSKLEETVKAQLHLDSVANPKFACEDILNLPDRDYKDQNTKAIRNRFIYLQNLKVKDPQHYWVLYAQANKAAGLSGPYRDCDIEEEEESNEDEPPHHTPAAQSSRERLRQTTPTTNISTPPPRLSNSKKKTMSGSRVKSSPAASSFAYNTMFDTLEAAETSGMFSLVVLFVCLLFLSF
jgi:hypothetical protein